MNHGITVCAVSATLGLAACSAEPPRAPGTLPGDMTAAEHCRFAHAYARAAAELARAASAPSGYDPASEARRAELRQEAIRDRQIAEQHAEAADLEAERHLFDYYEPPCRLDRYTGG